MVIEEWHKWFAFIAGDILLLAALFTLFRRYFTSAITSVLNSELQETKEHAKSTEEEVKKLVSSGLARDDSLRELTDTVNKIVYQVEPNKGGSLRDSVVRTERAVGELDDKIDSQIERLETKITERMDRIDTEVGDTRDRVATVEGQLRDR